MRHRGERSGARRRTQEEPHLEKDDGVVAADGGLEQCLCVGGRAARHQLHAGNGLEVGLQALRVLGAQLAAHAWG